MQPATRTKSVRGAQDLAALWATLPVAIGRWPLMQLPEGPGLRALSDTLRHRAWREHCQTRSLDAAAAVCVDTGRCCRAAPATVCVADALFPLGVGGGAPNWRMATLFVHWLPAAGELQVIAVGATAASMLDWACAVLAQRHGLGQPAAFDRRSLGDLYPVEGEADWGLRFVTPWVVAKCADSSAPAAGRLRIPDRGALEHELCDAIATRAHKLSALCSADPAMQRITGHLARHVAAALLPEALSVTRADVAPVVLPGSSRGNGHSYSLLAWIGELSLAVSPTALPWLGILSLLGGGRHADKGFGAVELIAGAG